MPRYRVRLETIHVYEEDVDAADEDSAEELVRDMYYDGDLDDVDAWIENSEVSEVDAVEAPREARANYRTTNTVLMPD